MSSAQSDPSETNDSDTGGSNGGRKVLLFGRLGPDDTRVLPELLRNETVGGALMLAATVAALLWANFGSDSYSAVRGTYVGPMSLQHWASDGLLTVFFFVAGLELKREFTSGSLAKPSEALLPVVAAIAGMVVPASIYIIVNLSSDQGNLGGWAIPMATDIAFALAILAAVGSRLPTSLRAFLLTLAIVDDLGAIIVIAVVFTSGLKLAWLAGALACAALWWFLQRKRVDNGWIYIPLFILGWWCMYSSGVHATIAGVLFGLLTRSDANDPKDPVDRWQHTWHPISAGVIVPIFALMAAGVAVNATAIRDVFTTPVGLGIVLGLVLGKPIGVFAGAYLTARFTKANLAPDLRWSEVFSVSMLAGVGFTVALFVSELAFTRNELLIEESKAAILIASLIAALVATVGLRRRTRQRMADAENA
ncbi:Na+/H+ antiporter NhaA [Enemella evansiae]|uniref:Na(+)/H(+) antiporter NhaA n=1 Tax=Enemella evansiae TaxID=2016499 RepID=A0A255GQY3_9ACTN|nr:Na+/H+ antiporter NhaA [Enemella evansiae]OYO16803.1 Na+/H+ antiporter NhaA [Enemella evansiae]